MTTKAYREANKDKINAYAKAYYAKNKDRKNKTNMKRNADRIKAHRDEIIDFPCGSHVTRGHYARHKPSDKHEHYETHMFVFQL